MRGYKEINCFRSWKKGNKLILLLPGGLFAATITHKYSKKKRR